MEPTPSWWFNDNLCAENVAQISHFTGTQSYSVRLAIVSMEWQNSKAAFYSARYRAAHTSNVQWWNTLRHSSAHDWSRQVPARALPEFLKTFLANMCWAPQFCHKLILFWKPWHIIKVLLDSRCVSLSNDPVLGASLHPIRKTNWRLNRNASIALLQTPIKCTTNHIHPPYKHITCIIYIAATDSLCTAHRWLFVDVVLSPHSALWIPSRLLFVHKWPKLMPSQQRPL